MQVYFCSLRSKKYERLQEASRVEFQRRQNEAAGYGSVLNAANNAVSFIKDTSAASRQATRPKAPRAKKGKPRSTSALD